MYDDHGEELFGHDGRHKPPRADLLTADGWGDSRGRLAYSYMNRQQEQNYSEYAIRTMGMMPTGYVIVNAKDVAYDKDTALKVGHNRVAIPVKEYARQRRLTLSEQWELLNPRWAGTYFGIGKQDFFCNKRPSLNDAITNAIYAGEMQSFMQRFWTADDGHSLAIERLQRRADTLNAQADDLFDEVMTLKSKIRKIESDIHYGWYSKYHLDGFNAHEYLQAKKDKLFIMEGDMNELRAKAKKITDYIQSITFNEIKICKQHEHH